MTLLVCPRCEDLSGPQETFCDSCGGPLTVDAARACARSAAAVAFRRSDLIGLERSESPSFAPPTLAHDHLAEPAVCVHRGNTPAQSGFSTFADPALAASPGLIRPQGRVPGCGTLGVASDGMPVALDPFGSRARLRDALHGDDGRPGNGRVGA